MAAVDLAAVDLVAVDVDAVDFEAAGFFAAGFFASGAFAAVVDVEDFVVAGFADVLAADFVAEPVVDFADVVAAAGAFDDDFSAVFAAVEDEFVFAAEVDVFDAADDVFAAADEVPAGADFAAVVEPFAAGADFVVAVLFAVEALLGADALFADDVLLDGVLLADVLVLVDELFVVEVLFEAPDLAVEDVFFAAGLTFAVAVFVVGFFAAAAVVAFAVGDVFAADPGVFAEVEPPEAFSPRGVADDELEGWFVIAVLLRETPDAVSTTGVSSAPPRLRVTPTADVMGTTYLSFRQLRSMVHQLSEWEAKS